MTVARTVSSPVADTVARQVGASPGGGSALPTPDEYLAGPITLAVATDVQSLSFQPDFTHSWTMAAWVKHSDRSVNFTVFGTTTNGLVHLVHFYPSGIDNGIEVFIGGSINGVSAVRHPNFLPTAAISNDTYFHIAVAWDDTAGEVLVYVNATLVVAAYAVSAPTTWLGTVTLGSKRLVGGERSDELLDGAMDDIRVYDSSVLSQDDITAIHAAALHA